MASTPTASAATWKMTLVARSCDTYTDVMANRARNDIQESLRDLGKDSVYVSGQPITPAIEEPNYGNCVPLVGWRFTFGDGINGADTGDFGSLSRVSHPIAHNIVTVASTPLLNSTGGSTGNDIAGAVTVNLTDTEASLARNGNLWVQGGSPGDPVMDSTFPGKYGFAALRCAVDNLNGDNVEFNRYPSGTTHIFCYGYYVTPPPTSGTIVIRKQVDVDAPQSYDEDFRFISNITYNASGDFTLPVRANAPASETFVRGETTAGVAPWTISEVVPAGWQLQSLTCTSSNGGSTITTSGGSASIRLAALDTVTCTYIDERDANGPLVIAKRTLGATGAFTFLAGLTGTKPLRHVIRTTRRGPPGTWTTPFTAAGTYRIAEIRPRTADGRWSLLSVRCDGARKPRRSVITHTMTRASGGSLCTFTNVFIPRGAIVVRGVTLGGTATINWLVTGPARRPAQFPKETTTTTPGDASTASGRSTGHLPLGTYAITQTGIVGDDRPWSLIDIACTGGIVGGPIPGGVTIRLTQKVTRVVCTFTNQAGERPPDPPDPPDPPAPPTPDPPIPDPGPTPPAHFVNPGTLPAGDVATGYGDGRSVPSVFRAGSPDAGLLQAAGDATTRDPRVHRGTRSRVDAMIVRVPRLGIRGRLQRLDLAGRRLRVPADPRRVGWWSGGALPGTPGSTVLAGHVDGPAGPAVFNRLAHARTGDLITISLPAGKPLRYRVTAVRSYTKGRMPRKTVFGASSANRLRLVTCGGRFDPATGSYDDNVVVYARLVR